MHAYTHACSHTCMLTHMHHTRTHTHTHAHTHVRTYTYARTHMYACTHVRTHTRTHTYTYAHTTQKVFIVATATNQICDTNQIYVHIAYNSVNYGTAQFKLDTRVQQTRVYLTDFVEAHASCSHATRAYAR